jgi:hypothetical protein
VGGGQRWLREDRSRRWELENGVWSFSTSFVSRGHDGAICAEGTVIVIDLDICASSRLDLIEVNATGSWMGTWNVIDVSCVYDPSCVSCVTGRLHYRCHVRGGSVCLGGVLSASTVVPTVRISFFHGECPGSYSSPFHHASLATGPFVFVYWHARCEHPCDWYAFC